MSTRRIAISSERIKNVTKSVTWQQAINSLPELGDYDEVYIDVSTASPVLFDDEWQNFKILREKLQDALWGDSLVFVIASPIDRNGSSTNYSILPFTVEISEASGTMFNLKEGRLYLDKVNGWSRTVELGVLHGKYASQCSSVIEILAETKHHKIAGAQLNIWDDNGGGGRGQVFILPIIPKKTPVESLQELVYMEAGSEEPESTLPDEIEAIILPGEEKKSERFDELVSTIKSLESEKAELTQYVVLSRKLKGVLAHKGKQLVRSVTQLCHEMGLELTSEAGDAHQEDKMLVLGKNSIPVEIKGGNGGPGEDDVLQVIKQKDKAIQDDGTVVRGILISNHDLKQPLADRPESFNPDLVAKATPFDLVLIKTSTLMKCYQTGNEKIYKALGQLILTTKGELSFEMVTAHVAATD